MTRHRKGNTMESSAETARRFRESYHSGFRSSSVRPHVLPLPKPPRVYKPRKRSPMSKYDGLRILLMQLGDTKWHAIPKYLLASADLAIEMKLVSTSSDKWGCVSIAITKRGLEYLKETNAAP